MRSSAIVLRRTLMIQICREHKTRPLCRRAFRLTECSALRLFAARLILAEIKNRLRKDRRTFLGRVVTDVIKYSPFIPAGEEFRLSFG